MPRARKAMSTVVRIYTINSSMMEHHHVDPFPLHSQEGVTWRLRLAV